MKDGQLVGNMESSWGNGITLGNVFAYAHTDSVDRPAVSPEEASSMTNSSQSVKKVGNRDDHSLVENLGITWLNSISLLCEG